MKDWLCESCLHRERGGAACVACEPEDPVRSCYQSLRAKIGSSYIDAAIRCPYYRWVRTSYRLLSCADRESGGDEPSLTQCFKSRQALRARLHEQCESDYESCALYRLLSEKYER